jgi:hypothetical protein
MKDDYLWDKSGEPDPEIQKLEEILGALRYQPQPLELPEDVTLQRRRSYLAWVAIAATVVMALLAGIIWLNLRSNNVPQPMQASVPQAPAPQKEKALVVFGPKEKVVPVQPSPEVAVNRKPRNKPSSAALRKREREREEALAAKQQLMLALRLASEKLNLAHRKTQSTPPANQIKNQHRIG